VAQGLPALVELVVVVVLVEFVFEFEFVVRQAEEPEKLVLLWLLHDEETRSTLGGLAYLPTGRRCPRRCCTRGPGSCHFVEVVDGHGRGQPGFLSHPRCRHQTPLKQTASGSVVVWRLFWW
jgi:hypothetical protein